MRTSAGILVQLAIGVLGVAFGWVNATGVLRKPLLEIPVVFVFSAVGFCLIVLLQVGSGRGATKWRRPTLRTTTFPVFPTDIPFFARSICSSAALGGLLGSISERGSTTGDWLLLAALALAAHLSLRLLINRLPDVFEAPVGRSPQS